MRKLFGPLHPRPSTTDPITNVVRLQPLDLKKHLPGIFSGKLSGDCLPALLHEGVHHWCFLTPLGQALALQQLRARTLLVVSETGNRHSPMKEVVDALARFHAIDAVLRPIAEGLALLQEMHGIIDYIWNRSISRPQYWSLWLACRAVPDAQKAEAFSSLFMEQAFSPEGVSRRVELLKNPFDCVLGGYLPGYMALRALWNRAALFHDSMRDVGAFIRAARFAVYHDAGLLQLAIDAPFVDYDEISFKTVRRLEEILTPAHLTDLYFLRTVFWTEAEVYEYSDLTHASECEKSRDGEMPLSMSYGEELTAAVLSLGRLFEQVTAWKLPSSLRGMNDSLLQRRDMFWLASDEGQLRVMGDRLFLKVEDGWINIGHVKASRARKQADFSGRVDLVFSLPDTWLILVASKGKTTLSIVPVSGDMLVDREKHEKMSLIFKGRAKIESAEETLTKTSNEKLDHDFQSQLNALRQKASGRADEFCARISLHTGSSPDETALIEALRIDGWAGPFANDANLLRALALASTTVTMGTYRPQPDELMRRFQIPDGSFEKVQSVLTELNLRFMISWPQPS
ncbi:MAG TPA: hypothetical protein VI685_16520 [Candidatus Angelobacter sp.]